MTTDGIKSKALRGLFFCSTVLLAALPLSAQLAVRHSEGIVHGFLILTTLDGHAVAEGEQTQSTRGDRITAHLIFRFKDGSIHQEDSVYSQRKTFQLISEHLVQKGPTFKEPIDVTFTVASGQVTVKATEKDGKEKVITEHVDIPADIANGVILILLKNLPPGDTEIKLPYLAATPKPRMVKLAVSSGGEDSFVGGGSAQKATHYVVKVEIGGVAGVVAPIVGKQPADTHVWILKGPVPAFVQSEGPLFQGGPVWRISLVSLRAQAKQPEAAASKP